ncbi:hypothetical protein CSPAE12_07500 [Colletotrichum incanum]|nr:hypothetical protein CSPAE12_07500 [Colletotrichum incanum]
MVHNTSPFGVWVVTLYAALVVHVPLGWIAGSCRCWSATSREVGCLFVTLTGDWVRYRDGTRMGSVESNPALTGPDLDSFTVDRL